MNSGTSRRVLIVAVIVVSLFSFAGVLRTIEKGIAADKIETRAEGEKQQLNEKDLEKLQSDDPTKPDQWMIRRPKATWLAYNRRVGVILEPSGQESTQSYPNSSMDAHILWQRSTPSLKNVQTAN